MNRLIHHGKKSRMPRHDLFSGERLGTRLQCQQFAQNHPVHAEEFLKKSDPFGEIRRQRLALQPNDF